MPNRHWPSPSPFRFCYGCSQKPGLLEGMHSPPRRRELMSAIGPKTTDIVCNKMPASGGGAEVPDPRSIRSIETSPSIPKSASPRAPVTNVIHGSLAGDRAMALLAPTHSPIGGASARPPGAQRFARQSEDPMNASPAAKRALASP